MGTASALAVAAAATASAWNTRHNGFVWDDRAAVVANEDVRGDRALWEAFTHDFWGTPIRAIDSHKSYRPLTILSFRLNHWLAGDSVLQQFHVTNMLIHVGCSLLVWRVAQALFLKRHDTKSSSSDDTMRPFEFKRVGATLAGLVFAVHPIHCDAVASIVGRADLLCTLLSLLAFLSYVNAVILLERTKWSAFMLAIVYAVAASLCKELGFTVFGLFLAYDIIMQLSSHYQHQQQAKADTNPFKRLQHRALIRRIAVIVLLTIALTLTRVWINGEHRQMQWSLLANNVTVQDTKWTRFLSYAHIHVWYLWKLVWPRSLCFDYGFKTIPIITTLWDPHNLYTLIAYSALLLGVCVGAKQLSFSGSRVLLMSIAFGVIPFIPASNLLFPVGTVVAERLLYFPSVGFCLLIGHILQQALSIAYKYGARDFAAANERRTGLTTETSTPTIMKTKSINIDGAFRRCYALTTLCMGFLLLCGCYRSQLHNAEWANETSLFHAALRVSPTNNKVLVNIGKTLLKLDNEQAIKILHVAMALLPHQVEGHTNLGLAYWHQRDLLFAARHLYKSAHFGARHFQGAGYTGCLLFDLWLDEHQTKEGGFTTEAFHISPTIQIARENLDLAIESRSYYPIHYYTRARLAYYAGEYDDVIRFCDLALQVNAAVLKKTIDRELILRASQVYNLMAISHTASGNKELVLETIAAGLQLDAQEIDLHANAAMLYAERKDMKRGNFHLEALVRLATSQRHMRTLNIVAQAMERLGQPAAATLCRLKANALAAESERLSSPLATSSAPKAAADTFELKLTAKPNSRVEKTLQLVCVLVGVPGNAVFIADVQADDSVHTLKDAVKKNNQHACAICDARELRLYLAQRDNNGARLSVAEAKALTRGELSYHFVELDAWRLLGDEGCFGRRAVTPGRAEVHVLVAVPTREELRMQTTKKYALDLEKLPGAMCPVVEAQQEEPQRSTVLGSGAGLVMDRTATHVYLHVNLQLLLQDDVLGDYLSSEFQSELKRFADRYGFGSKKRTYEAAVEEAKETSGSAGTVHIQSTSPPTNLKLPPPTPPQVVLEKFEDGNMVEVLAFDLESGICCWIDESFATFEVAAPEMLALDKCKSSSIATLSGTPVYICEFPVESSVGERVPYGGGGGGDVIAPAQVAGNQSPQVLAAPVSTPAFSAVDAFAYFVDGDVIGYPDGPVPAPLRNDKEYRSYSYIGLWIPRNLPSYLPKPGKTEPTRRVRSRKMVVRT